ncbi:MAG: exodeoxyribonuclease V subunit alpha [Bacteriovorax sp.]|nr:exodeoxyribonuclease V subunit alpha [Rhizobacter sp.]
MTTDSILPTPSLLATLKAWSEQGWLRRLDSAFAGFMTDLCPAAPAPVVMAAALVAHVEGRGHSCLAVDDLLRDADALLGWAPLASVALSEVMANLPREAEAWLSALRASPLVATDGPGTDSSDAADDAAEGTADDRSSPPLVLRGSKLYLRRYWDHERRIAAQVLQRGAAVDVVDEPAARQWLDRLFPSPPADGVATETTTETAIEPAIDWQKVACGVALRGRLSVITGGPGTGKTHTAARLLALLFAMDAEPQRLRVALAAPTGKAAARLKQSIAAALQALQSRLGDSLPLAELAAHIGAARTLHGLLGARPDTRRFRFDAAHPLEVDVLIVDEASMIHLEMMAALLDALPARARVVFLGDKDQLASVEAGAVLGDLCRDAEQGRYRADTAAFIEAVTGQRLPAQFLGHGPALAQQTVMLRESRRFSGLIGQLAAAVNAGDAKAAVALLKGAAAGQPLHWLDAPTPAAVVHLAVHGRAGVKGAGDGYAGYLDALRQRPEAADRAGYEAWALSVLTAFERFRLLCAVREGDWGAAGLNTAIERVLVAEGRLVKRGEWYEGRPVMVTRNDPGVGVFNGDIGIVLKPLDIAAPLRAFFLDGTAVRSVGVSRLANVETAFAMTVHKSQGSEFEHTVLVLPQEPSQVLTRELVYTGITRARQAFTLVTGRPQAFAQALAQRTRRASGLLELLDDGG